MSHSPAPGTRGVKATVAGKCRSALTARLRRPPFSYDGEGVGWSKILNRVSPVMTGRSNGRPIVLIGIRMNFPARGCQLPSWQGHIPFSSIGRSTRSPRPNS
jgi:hypothetical protein